MARIFLITSFPGGIQNISRQGTVYGTRRRRQQTGFLVLVTSDRAAVSTAVSNAWCLLLSIKPCLRVRRTWHVPVRPALLLSGVHGLEPDKVLTGPMKWNKKIMNAPSCPRSSTPPIPHSLSPNETESLCMRGAKWLVRRDLMTSSQTPSSTKNKDQTANGCKPLLPASSQR